MVTLTRHPTRAIYLSQPSSPEASGVAFAPAVDDGASTITLDTTFVRNGFFSTWTGGIPSADDFAAYERVLLEARASATAEGRTVLQMFRSGTFQPLENLTASGSTPVVDSRNLTPRDANGTGLDRAHKLSLQPCVIDVSGGSLTFQPTSSGSGHNFKQTDAVLPAENVVIPIEGPQAGSFSATSKVKPAELSASGFVSEFTKRKRSPDDGGTGEDPIYEFDSERRPLIAGGGSKGEVDVAFEVSFDPLDGLNRDRTFFRPTEQILLSNFRTTHGHKVLLSVQSSQSGADRPQFSYVRQRRQQAEGGNAEFLNINLLLEGEFNVTLADDEGADAPSPEGAFGVVIADSQHEFLEAERPSDMTAAAPLKMTFRRGASHFDKVASEVLAAAENDSLIAEDGTSDQASWAKLHRSGSEGPVISEARGMRRLVASDAAQGGSGRFTHDPFRLTRREESLKHKPDGFVPVLPRLANEALSDATIEEGESSLSTLLSVERRKMLGVKSSVSQATAEASTKRTPLGFELVEGSGGISSIVIARTGEDSAVELSIKNATPGEPVPAPILDALVRNQLFLVANARDVGAKSMEFELNATLALSKWGFQIDLFGGWETLAAQGVAADQPYPPLMIVKGFEGLTLEDLVGKPQLWSGMNYLRSGDVTQSPAAFAAQQFKSAKERALKKPNDPIYRDFLAAIRDPAWAGVLILGVPLSLGVLPDQVKGLLGGIDTSRLVAHHFAVPVKRIESGANVSLSKPFAAVDYEAEGKVPYIEADDVNFDGPGQAPNGADGVKNEIFNMKVIELRAGFANGAIQSFDCRLDLTIGAFFHDRLTNPKVIQLKGIWQRRVVDGKTFETYDFIADTTIEIKMSDGFPLIEKGTITRVSCVSEVTEQGGDEIVSSKYLINGSIDWKELNDSLGDFDFLNLKTTNFTGLSLDMRFRVAAGSVGFPKFRFSPGGLLFDFDAAALKDEARGFFGSLPIKFTGFGWLGDALSLPELGFFGLGKGTGGKTPFFLKFDLDLGSLGSFASALAKFRMELGFAFGLDKFNKPQWNLGFRFAGGGGKDLDIGLEGFLQLTCERYEVVTLKSQEGGTDAETYYGFRGVNAKLIVFGTPLPEDANANIFIFVNPAKLGQGEGVGWFLALKPEEGSGNDVIDLKVLALGQRVDPLQDLPGGLLTTRQVVAKLGEVAGGVVEHDDKPYEIPKVKFAPDRGWTIGFHAILYRFIELGFAVRDPDLAGVLLDVKVSGGSTQTLFSVDILYRKLTEHLGVYSTEIILPESLRNWQFGAVGLTLPYIGVEIFTDGNWGIDLGYPANKDFSRAFALSIFPFVGAGGFYYRRVAGTAARLIPQAPKFQDGDMLRPARGDEIFRYDPVTEVGLGLRVGLGAVVAQGILNAGLSLTVYGYLEGGFGKLYNPAGKLTQAASTYITVRGAVGIMGEFYGYVDFGIIKAGVFVQLYVEVGVNLETDKATELYYEVGVRVRVRVVIGSFKIFGKRIEIAICFSFSTSVRFSQKIGNDRNREYYEISQGQSAPALAFTALRGAPDWTLMPTPLQWANLQGRLPIDLAVQPDVTIVPGTSGPEAHAVFLMAATLNMGEEATSAERLVQGLTAWALCAVIPTLVPDSLLVATVKPAQLREASRALARGDFDQPSYAQITQWLQLAFAGTIRPLDEPASVEADGVILPMPEAIAIGRVRRDFGGNEIVDDVSLAQFRFVDEAYRNDVDEAFKRLMLEDAARVAASDTLAATDQSLAAVLFEEWTEMIMRGGMQHLANFTESDNPESDRSVRELLEKLVAPSQTAEQDVKKLRSVAAETIASTGRFFTYGQRLPHPAHASPQDLPSWLEPVERPSDAGSDLHQRFFHAMLRLSGQQMPIDGAVGFRIEKGIYDGWLTAVDDIGTAPDGDTTFKAVEVAAAAMDLPGTIEVGALYKPRKRYIAIGSEEASIALSGGASRHKLWSFGREARIAAENGAEELFTSTPDDGELREFTALGQQGNVQPAIVLDVTLRRPESRSDTAGADDPLSIKDAFEIKAIPEPLRNLIDMYAPLGDGGDPSAPAIKWIGLFKTNDEAGLDLVGAGQVVTLVQSNLSVETKPGSDVQMLADEPDRIEPVADISQHIDFVRLLRQAAIVNTGGYHLTYEGADDELRNLFMPPVGGAEPLNAGGRLRVVIALEGNEPGAMSAANALLTDPDFGQGVVLAFAASDTVDALHEPGIVPIVARRTDSFAAGSIEAQLADRFSNLAVFAEVKNAAGQSLGTQYLDQAVPVGPDFDEKDDDGKDQDPGREQVFRTNLPVARIAGIVPQSAQSAYDLVGGSVRIEAGWRDIYGNAWRKPFAKQDIPLVYNDRLLGLTGLPYIKATFWPNDMIPGLLLELASSYEPLFSLDGQTSLSEDVPKDWATATSNDLRRCVAMLRRAAAQVADPRVTVTLRSTLGGAQRLEKTLIVAHISNTGVFLTEASNAIAAAGGNMTREKLVGRLRAIQAEGPTNIPVRLKPVTDEIFTELKVELSVERPAPSDHASLYPTSPFDGEMTERFMALLAEMSATHETVSPNLSGQAAKTGRVAADVKQRDSEDLARDLAKLASGHRLATGYGENENSTERAIWLIQRDYFARIGDASLYAPKRRVALALPPLWNEAYSHSFVDIAAANDSERRVEIRDADADAYGRDAMALIERLLSPLIIVPMLKSSKSEDRKKARQAINDLLFVKERLATTLANRLKPVFADIGYDPSINADRRDRAATVVADVLLRDLRNHYKISCVMAYFDRADHPASALQRPVHGVVGATDKGMRFTSYSLPLDPEGGAVSHDLIIMCEPMPEPGHPASDSYPLPSRFDVSHIQRRPVPDVSFGTKSYRATAWLRLLDPLSDSDDTPWTAISLPDSGGSVPNPLRQLPQSPLLEAEGYESEVYSNTDTPADNLAAARRWKSRRDIQWEAAPQDRLRVTVCYERRPVTQALASTEDLVTRIVRFVIETQQEMPRIEAGDLAAYAWVANRARSRLVAETSDVQALGETPTLPFDAVTLREIEVNGGLEVEGTSLSLVSKGIDYWDTENGSEADAVKFRKGSTELPVPLPGGVSEPGLKKRTLTTVGLDIVDLASARTELSLSRNEKIGDLSLDKAFVYRLPTIGSGEDTVPVLDIADTITAGRFNPDDAASIEGTLRDFLKGLLAPTTAGTALCSADIVFEYETGLFEMGQGAAVGEGGGPVVAVRGGVEISQSPDPAGEIAKEIQNWFASNRPARRQGKPIGSVIADARVFAGSTVGGDKDRRILRLSRCRFDFA